jgi:hypothetical protein
MEWFCSRTPIFSAGEHLEQRRLARAVRPGQAVAFAGVELQTDVLEKDLGAVALRDIGEDDHGG